MNPVGMSIPRIDGVAKVTGTAQYCTDLNVPGMLHTAAVRSPYPHARVVRIETKEAMLLPGVVTLTRDDLAATNVFFGPVLKDQPIVAVDKVRYVGDLVAAVAAEGAAVAEEAADLIEVEYEPLRAVFDPLTALEPEAPVLHERFLEDAEESRRQSIQPGLDKLELFSKGNLFSSDHFESGDVEQGFAESDFVFEDTYRVPPIQHGHLEPHGALAYWEGDGRLVVHCSSQDPWVVRNELAELFRLPMSRIRVMVPYLGGGFGAKLYPRIEPVVVALARKAGKPVRWIMTREEEFLTITRHAAVVRIKTGVRHGGQLVARQMEVVYDGGAYSEISPRVVAQNGAVAAGPYRIPNVSVDCSAVYTCKPPAGAYRGFGVPQIAWASESQLDEIARSLRLDPLEIRLMNLYAEGDEYLTGERLWGVGVQDCLESVANAIEWRGMESTEPSQGQREGHIRGIGLACTIKSTMTPSNSAASLRLDPDGSLHILTSAVEIGQGTATVLAQIASQSLGIPMEYIRVATPDTDTTPFDHGTKSSRITFTLGQAVQEAALGIRRQLIEIAAAELEAAAEDVEIVEGVIRVRGTDVGLTIAEVFTARFGLPVGNLYGNHVLETVGGLDPVTHKGIDSAFWMWGAVAAEVEVDGATGKVRVVRLASAIDVGKAINPRQCHLQNEGSVTMGLGSALFEEMLFDNGQLLNGSFANYMLPSMEDFPASFHSLLVEHPHPDGPFGAKGVGEASLPAVAPAIGNAVANALGGRRIKVLPIRADRVIAAIERDPGDDYQVPGIDGDTP